MSDPKIHHYIPQAYLDKWTDSKTSQLARFSRVGPQKKSKYKYCGTRSSGQEEKIYAVEGLGPEGEFVVEKKFYSVIDNAGGIALNELLDDGFTALTDEKTWWRYLVSFLFRNPRDLHRVRHALGEPEIFFDSDGSEFGSILEISGDPVALSFAVQKAITNLIDENPLYPHLGKMEYVVVALPTGLDKEFCTSDHPLIMPEPFASENFTLAIPISPRKLFFASKRRGVTKSLKKFPPAPLVDAMNTCLIKNALQYVFSSSPQKHKALVEEHLRLEKNNEMTSSENYSARMKEDV